MICNTSKDNIIILVNNRISVIVITGISKISDMWWRMLGFLCLLLMGAAMFCDGADLFSPVVPALNTLPSPAWVVYFVLLAGFTIIEIRM